MSAGGLGIEPKLTASKAAVLPLDDPPIFLTSLEYFKNRKNSSSLIKN